jgi:hypothetical protein
VKQSTSTSTSIKQPSLSQQSASSTSSQSQQSASNSKQQNPAILLQQQPTGKQTLQSTNILTVSKPAISLTAKPVAIVIARPASHNARPLSFHNNKASISSLKVLSSTKIANGAKGIANGIKQSFPAVVLKANQKACQSASSCGKSSVITKLPAPVKPHIASIHIAVVQPKIAC